MSDLPMTKPMKMTKGQRAQLARLVRSEVDPMGRQKGLVEGSTLVSFDDMLWLASQGLAYDMKEPNGKRGLRVIWHPTLAGHAEHARQLARRKETA